MHKKQSKPRLVKRSELVLLDKMPTGGGSDSALKQNVTHLLPVLDQVKALRPVVWNWKGEADGRQEYGFIAQEVEKILPDLVYMGTWKDGTKRKFLSSKALLPYLIGALQELQAEIEDLQTRLDNALRSNLK